MAECLAALSAFIPLRIAQTAPTALYSLSLVVTATYFIAQSSKIFDNERFSFKCNTNYLYQQECLDQYNWGPNQLQANQLLPGMHFAAEIVMLIVSIVVRNVVAKKHMQGRNPGRIHIYTVHFSCLAIRCLFYFAMIMAFSMLHEKLSLSSTFHCKLPNSTKTLHCTDSKASAKSNLNVGQFVVDSLYLLITIVEFIWHFIIWRKLDADTGGRRCQKCKQFMLKLFISSLETIPEEEEEEDEEALGTIPEEDVEGVLDNSTTVADDRLQCSSKHLKDKYKRRYQKHTITCVESTELKLKDVDLDKFAVDVTVVEGQEVASLPNERSEFISKLHDIRSQRSVELNELVDHESEERVSFIRGLAGIGKTILAKQIALKWANGSIFQNFTHLCVLECRNLNNETSLDDLLKREFFGNSVPEGNKIMFIIDGIDEVDDLETKFESNSSIIYQLLDISSDRYVGSKVILTGRPHVQSTLESREGVRIIGNMKMFEIIGLSEKSINEYIDLFTEKEPQKVEAIQKTRDSSQNINVLMSIPQYLNTMCCVAILTGGKAISNTTELYLWLLFLFFKSHIKDVDEMSEIFSKYFDFIKLFGKISYKLLLKKTIVFKQKDFTDELKELTDNEKLKDIFNVFCIEVSGIQMVKTYQFKHLTLQEFFASLYCLIERLKPKELVKNKNFEIITFMCGFYGGMLKTKDEHEESILNIVIECLESEGKEEGDEGRFLSDVLHALMVEIEDERYLLKRALAYIAEYFNPKFKYCNKQLMPKIIYELSRGFRRSSEGPILLSVFDCKPSHTVLNCSSLIAQSDLEKVLKAAVRNDSLKEFKEFHLFLNTLENFSLCQYFEYFYAVDVSVKSILSLDKLNLLFEYSMYCNKVTLNWCKMVGDDCKLKELRRALDTKGDQSTQSRLERLRLLFCFLDERNWKEIIEIIAKIKKVKLHMMTYEWEDLVNVIEKEKKCGLLKLEQLEFYVCNVDDKLIERIRAAGIMVIASELPRQMRAAHVTVDFSEQQMRTAEIYWDRMATQTWKTKVTRRAMAMSTTYNAL